ncbi:unnamed protein product [Orchesella dallaii]|uniref:RING-type domain-containing protein n=1 Tax=Orchesella dallaii TaxID=48710 RepID=A0ABP1QXM8_9HEXA
MGSETTGRREPPDLLAVGAIDDEKCPECWSSYNKSDFRRVKDDLCGHVKCRRCLIKSENCVMCISNVNVGASTSKASATATTSSCPPPPPLLAIASTSASASAAASCRPPQLRRQADLSVLHGWALSMSQLNPPLEVEVIDERPSSPVPGPSRRINCSTSTSTVSNTGAIIEAIMTEELSFLRWDLVEVPPPKCHLWDLD